MSEEPFTTPDDPICADVEYIQRWLKAFDREEARHEVTIDNLRISLQKTIKKCDISTLNT